MIQVILHCQTDGCMVSYVATTIAEDLLDEEHEGVVKVKRDCPTRWLGCSMSVTHATITYFAIGGPAPMKCSDGCVTCGQPLKQLRKSTQI